MPYITRKRIKYGALLVPTLLLSFINIGTVFGDASEAKNYFTPLPPPTTNAKILDDYADDSVYLIDLKRFEFTPTFIQISKDDVLIQEEELSEDEHQLIYEIDFKLKPEGRYTITISDEAGKAIKEHITHKAT